jgi:hypothetical protein
VVMSEKERDRRQDRDFSGFPNQTIFRNLARLHFASCDRDPGFRPSDGWGKANWRGIVIVLNPRTNDWSKYSGSSFELASHALNSECPRSPFLANL